MVFSPRFWHLGWLLKQKKLRGEQSPGKTILVPSLLFPLVSHSTCFCMVTLCLCPRLMPVKGSQRIYPLSCVGSQRCLGFHVSQKCFVQHHIRARCCLLGHQLIFSSFCVCSKPGSTVCAGGGHCKGSASPPSPSYSPLPFSLSLFFLPILFREMKKR